MKGGSVPKILSEQDIMVLGVFLKIFYIRKDIKEHLGS
jgi:hypothetical protein